MTDPLITSLEQAEIAMSDAVMTITANDIAEIIESRAEVEDGYLGNAGYIAHEIYLTMLAASTLVGGLGSRPQEAVPGEGHDAAVVGDDDWIEWRGGENPAPGKTVQIIRRYRERMKHHGGAYLSDNLGTWMHRPIGYGGDDDIIAYRIVPQPADGCSSNEGAGQ